MYSLKKLRFTLFLFSLLSCSEAEQKAEVEVTETAPAQQGIGYADSTSERLQALLQTYYSLKDAMVSSDSAKAALLSERLVQKADSINLSSLQKKDQALFASVKALPVTIKQAAIALGETKELEAQRAIFETISDNLYELIKTIKPSGIATYHQYCPMAFDDKGAYWLSDRAQINNPYLGLKHYRWGNKMLHCGEVADSLFYQ